MKNGKNDELRDYLLRALEGLDLHRAMVVRQLALLGAAPATPKAPASALFEPPATPATPTGRKSRLSEAGRKRIAAAMRKRWRNVKLQGMAAAAGNRRG